MFRTLKLQLMCQTNEVRVTAMFPIKPKWMYLAPACLCLLLTHGAIAAQSQLPDNARELLEAMQPGFKALAEGRAQDAFALWKPLAEQDFAPAQHNVALLYEKGRGVPQSQVDAVQWFWLAELNGYSRSAKNRQALQKALPAPAFEALCEKLKKRLAENVLADGGRKARRFARLLEESPRALETQAEDAYVWNAVAVALGDSNAIPDRDRLAKGMAPERLVELQALSVGLFDHSLPPDTLAKDYPPKSEEEAAEQ